MPWPIFFDDECAVWFEGLNEGLQDAILALVGLLREYGPQLGRPRVDTLKGSKFDNMKELRVQYAGEPWRILFAFDPERNAILLVGGNKAGDKGWYKRNIPIAEDRYAVHLRKIRE